MALDEKENGRYYCYSVNKTKVHNTKTQIPLSFYQVSTKTQMPMSFIHLIDNKLQGQMGFIEFEIGQLSIYHCFKNWTGRFNQEPDPVQPKPEKPVKTRNRYPFQFFDHSGF